MAIDVPETVETEKTVILAIYQEEGVQARLHEKTFLYFIWKINDRNVIKGYEMWDVGCGIEELRD